MSGLRVLRIAAFAAGFFVAFTVSQQATLAREGTTLPGLSVAIGVLSLFFLIGAVITERTQGPDANPRKDLLWGLATGGIAIVISRL